MKPNKNTKNDRSRDATSAPSHGGHPPMPHHGGHLMPSSPYVASHEPPSLGDHRSDPDPVEEEP